MERREFLKTTCAACLGLGFLAESLASCASLPVYRTTVTGKDVTVPVDLFRNTDLQIVRVDRFDYDIALRKLKDGTFLALSMRCTHADNPLTCSGTGFTCSLHGSSFDLQGRVTHGPASLSLKRLKTEVEGGNVTIIADGVL